MAATPFWMTALLLYIKALISKLRHHGIKRRFTMRAFLPFTLRFFVVIAIAINTANPAQAQTAAPESTAATAGNTLVDLKGAIDTLRIEPSAFNSATPLKVFIAPASITYSKQKRRPEP